MTRALTVSAMLLAGCASLTVPRGPVWVFDVSYSAIGQQIVFNRDAVTCYKTRMEFLGASTNLQPAFRPSAIGACRPATIVDDALTTSSTGGTGAPVVYWAVRLRAEGGLGLTTQASCRAAARANALSEGTCTPVVILPMEPPPAEPPK